MSMSLLMSNLNLVPGSTVNHKADILVCNRDLRLHPCGRLTESQHYVFLKINLTLGTATPPALA